MECCRGQGEAAEVPNTQITHHLEPDLGQKEPHLLPAHSEARLLGLHVTVTICCLSSTVQFSSSSGSHLLCCVNVYAFHILNTLPSILSYSGIDFKRDNILYVILETKFKYTGQVGVEVYSVCKFDRYGKQVQKYLLSSFIYWRKAYFQCFGPNSPPPFPCDIFGQLSAGQVLLMLQHVSMKH